MKTTLPLALLFAGVMIAGIWTASAPALPATRAAAVFATLKTGEPSF